MTSYLTTNEVKQIHQRVMQHYGENAVLRDPNLLDSAVNRPQQAAYYNQASLLEQAAILIDGIAKAHAFVDGNKRTAMVAGGLFLELNGYELTDPNALAPVIEQLVVHSMTVVEVADWLAEHTAPMADDPSSPPGS